MDGKLSEPGFLGFLGLPGLMEHLYLVIPTSDYILLA